MPSLNPDGFPVIIEGVELVTPGLTGTVEIHTSGGADARGAQATSDAFRQALEDTGLIEDVTVEILDHEEVDGGSGSRAGSGESMEITVTGPGVGFGQVVLYTAEDGSLSWHLPDEIEPEEIPQRGPAQLTYRIPRAIVPTGSSDGQRGISGAIGKKIIEVLFFRLADAVIGAAGNWFAARYEEKHRPHLLRIFDPETHTVGRVLQPGDWDLLCGGRALLFIHGTASSCLNGFKTLPATVMDELNTRYGGRVFAFDHPTISVLPSENVRWFADQLPTGKHLELDIIAHSRGGLVGRVMAEQFADVGLTGRVDIRTLVMVATPNAGTALADHTRLKHLLDRLTNLVQFVPDNGVTDVLDIVLSVLKQLAIGLLTGLDGLMSMDPHGRFLTEYLNVPGKINTKYYAVAANYDPPAGSPLLRIARNGATDLVFGRDENDLVVPTAGVFMANGNGNFPIASPVVFGAADGVDHSTYWFRTQFLSAVGSWLTGT